MINDYVAPIALMDIHGARSQGLKYFQFPCLFLQLWTSITLDEHFEAGVAQLAQQIRQARPEAPTLRALTPLTVHRIKSPICSARSRSWSRGPSRPRARSRSPRSVDSINRTAHSEARTVSGAGRDVPGPYRSPSRSSSDSRSTSRARPAPARPVLGRGCSVIILFNLLSIRLFYI
jgi:hypothetical protein